MFFLGYFIGRFFAKRRTIITYKKPLLTINIEDELYWNKQLENITNQIEYDILQIKLNQLKTK